MNEAGVMTDVGVGQKYPREASCLGGGRQGMELLWKVRGGVE
jgi:hypothetical protein